MQAKIEALQVHCQASDPTITRPYKVTVTLHGFVTAKEMRMLQIAKIQDLSLSSIGCVKLKGMLKNEAKDNRLRDRKTTVG